MESGAHLPIAQARRPKRAIDIKGAELFSAGTWNGRQFTIDDIDNIVKSFSLLDLAGRVPLKLGHDSKKPPLKDGEPALGWVQRLYRDGKKLVADFTGIPSALYDFIKEGLYKFISVELLADVKADTREIPWVLDAVALLGADKPAVGMLKDLQSLTMTRSTEFQCRERVAFSRENHTGGHKPHMAEDNDTKAILARLEAAERERDTLKLTAQRVETAEAKLSELQTKTLNDKIAAHRTSLMLTFETPIKDKKILPSVREQFKRIYKTETDAVLDVTPTDAESFMRLHPNPDAPRTQATVQGDANDPADKALFSARKALNETRIDPSKPRDQVLVESIMAQMRANPDLGKAWQDAPGYIGPTKGGQA